MDPKKKRKHSQDKKKILRYPSPFPSTRKIPKPLRWIRNEKVMRFEISRDQNEKNEKEHVLQVEKMYFLCCYFLAGLLALHFKGDL